MALVLALLSSLPRRSSAEGTLLPSGTVVQVPGKPTLTLDVNKFLIERSDVDYYNSIQLRLNLLTATYEECEQQVTQLRAEPKPQPSFWDGAVGRSILITGAVLVGGFAGYMLKDKL